MKIHSYRNQTCCRVSLSLAKNLRALILAAAVSGTMSSYAIAQDLVHFSGTVVDSFTNAPVGLAKVTIRAQGIGDTTAFTNEVGVFSFKVASQRVYAVLLEMNGYASWSDTLTLSSAPIPFTIRLIPKPVKVPGVIGSTERRNPRLAGFWERKHRGRGYFFTHEDIQKKKAHRLSEIIRIVPGAKVLPTRQGGVGRIVTFGRSFDKCGQRVAMIYLDGIPYIPSELGLDDVAPDDVAAIEVYPGASQIPAEFARPGYRPRPNQIESDPACGAIVIWTKDGR